MANEPPRAAARSPQRAAARSPRRAAALSWIPYAFFFAAGLAWTVSLWLRSPGTSFQDEIAHVLIAKNAWNHPSLILDVWGRVANTLIYMVPARFGLDGARLASVLMSCLTVVLATRLAQRMGVKRLWLVPLLLWFQYWGADLMYAASTTVPLTLFLVLAIHEWSAGRLASASLAFGILPLVRHEGIALLGAWGLYVLLKRNWRAVAVAAAPVLLYNVAYLVVLRPPLSQLPLAIYVKADNDPHYGSGDWFHYVKLTLHGIGVVVCAWAAVGCLAAWRDRARLLWLAPYALLYLVHTVIYRFNAFASGGYYFFLSPIAPGVAIVAALGAQEFVDRGVAFASSRLVRAHTRLLAVTAFAAIVALPVFYKALTTQAPRLLVDEERGCVEAANWLRSRSVAPENVVSTHVYVYLYYDLPWRPDLDWTRPPPVASMPPGTFAVWDQNYSDRWGMKRDGFREELGWQRVAQFDGGEVEIYERR